MGVKQTLPAVADNNGQRNINNNNNNNNLIHLTKQLSGRSGGGGGDASHYSAMHISNHHAGLSSTMTTGSNSTYGLPPETQTLVRQLEVDWCAFDKHFDTIAALLVDRLLQCEVYDSNAPHVDEHGNINNNNNNNNMTANLFSCNSFGSMPESFDDTLRSEDSVLMVPPSRRQPYSVPCPVPLQHSSSHPATHSGRIYPQAATAAAAASVNGLRASTVSVSSIGSNASPRPCPPVNHLSATYSNNASTDMLQPHPPPLSAESCVPPHAAFAKISVALRLAVLDLGHIGVRRVLDALAFSATGECRGDRERLWGMAMPASNTGVLNNNNNMGKHFSNGDVASLTACKRFAASTDSNSNNNLNSSMKKGMSSNSAFSHNNHNHHNNNNIGGAKSVSSMGALSMTVGSQQQQQSQARMIASMQQQQCQMRMAPSTFGEQSYNSVLLLSMHARSLPNAASLSWDFNAPGNNSFQQIGGGGGGGSGRTTTHSTPHPPGCSMSDMNVRPSRVFPAFPPAPEEPMMAAVMTSVSGGGVLQQLQSSFSGASYGGMGTNNHLDATTDGNELRPDFMPRAVQSLCDPSDDKGLGLRNMHHTDVINMVCHTLAHLHLSPRDIQDFLEAAVDITRNVTRDILEENNNNNNSSNNNNNNNNNSNSKLSVVMTHKTLHHTNFVVKELTDFVFTPRLHHSLRILRFISAGEVSNNTAVNALSVGALPPLSRTPSRCPSRNGAFEVQHVSASNNNNNNNNNTNNSNVNVLCSQAHQYFREMSVMDVGGSANNDAANNNNNNNNNNNTQLARQQTRWQEEILVRRRCFVLHYAETLGAMRAGRDSNSQPSSQPSTTLSPHPPPSRSQGGTKVPGETSFSSTSFLSAVETGNGNGGNGGGGRSATAAVASSTQQSSAATSCSEEGRLCWPLRTRLLSLQQHYLYIFDAMSSSLLLTGSSSAEVTSAVPAAIAAEMHSPIVLVDTSCVTAGADFRVIKTGAESETLRLHPSRRVRRRENQPPHPPFLDGSQPNAVRGSSVADVDVYRVQSQSDGQMMLLTVPAGAPVLAQHNSDIPMSHHNSKDKSRTQSLSSSGLRGDDASAARSTASHCLSPPPPPPPPPPPTASNTNSHSRSRMGSGVEPPDSTSSSSSRYAFSKDVAVVHGSDPVTFIVYPLRFIHRGVLHHLFFQNASTRVQWAESLMVLSTVNQSRAHALRVAQAEQYTDFFIRRRISYPIGPSAFEYVDMLGAGAFGRVLLVRHILTGKPFALKVVRKTSFHGVRNVIEARRERAVMESLDCPYILKLHTTFQTDSRFYLLLDYLSGGELLLHTQKAKGHRFDEATARFFVAELAIAVEHLRLNGVVHRDVKGDNLVLDDEGHVVLTDFGFAKKITTEEELFPKKGDNPAGRVVGQRTSCGTRAYIAPEVIDLRSEGYGLEVDWWSMGVVLFTLLTGFFPFLKQTEHDTNQAITQAPLQFPPQMALTEAAKSVLLGLMNKNPAKRIAKLSQLKKHPFFAGFDWEACEQRKLKPPFQLHKDAFVKPTSSSSAARRLKENVAAAREDILLAQQQLDDPQPMDIARHHNTNSNTNSNTNRSKRTSTTAPTTTNQRYVAELAEECEELRRVEAAYGEGCTPYPTHVENNLFGSLYQRQELLGSMRDIGGAGGAVGDVDADTDYIPPLFTEMSGLWHCAREPSLSASFSAAAAAQLMDDCFEPVVEDYCEAAYASASDIRPVDARMGSVTSFYRPVYDPR